MSAESFFEVQLTQVEEDARVAELVRTGYRLIEQVERFDARAKEVADLRAGKPRRPGKSQPPGRLSRQVLDDVDRIGVLLGEAVAVTQELRREGNPS